MTLAQWAALDEDVEGELVDGFLEEEEVANVLHDIIVVWLGAILWRWARRQRGIVTASDTKIAVGPRRGRKPDLSVFLPPFVPAVSDTLVRAVPHLAVEIVSPRARDRRRDRVDKLIDYAQAGVPFYAIFDPQARRIEVYEIAGDGRYTLKLEASGGRKRIPGCPGLVLDLAALWSEIDDVARARMGAE